MEGASRRGQCSGPLCPQQFAHRWPQWPDPFAGSDSLQALRSTSRQHAATQLWTAHPGQPPPMGTGSQFAPAIPHGPRRRAQPRRQEGTEQRSQGDYRSSCHFITLGGPSWQIIGWTPLTHKDEGDYIMAYTGTDPDAPADGQPATATRLRRGGSRLGLRRGVGPTSWQGRSPTTAPFGTQPACRRPRRHGHLGPWRTRGLLFPRHCSHGRSSSTASHLRY